MTHTTAPGWPDPSEWSNKLLEELRLRNAQYVNPSKNLEGYVSDDDDENAHIKRRIIAVMLGSVIQSLRELPVVSGEKLTAPLRDLLAALKDLDDGITADFLKPVNLGKGARGQGIKNELFCARICYLMTILERLGKGTQVERAKFIASNLNAAGFKGTRKRGEVSHQTIIDWDTRARGSELAMQRVAGMIEKDFDRVVREYGIQSITDTKLKDAIRTAQNWDRQSG
jgi:hypothetical protein